MTKKILKQSKMVGLAASLGLVAGLALAPQNAMAETGYTTNTLGGVVKSGSGLCWRSPGGMREMFPECGDVVVEVEEMEVMAPLDSDGDGVPDDRDQCPNTPAGVAVDAVGCPLDSDGDGVPDFRDRCPGTPLGNKVDADGCDIIESMVIDLQVEEFDFNSAELRPPMKDALDNLADTIQRSRGEETMTIVGHTDSVGPAAYNQGLSERRAQSAADHLISQGIDADRITVRGEGESNPIATNDTAKGRAQNRRIEVQTR